MTCGARSQVADAKRVAAGGSTAYRTVLLSRLVTLCDYFYRSRRQRERPTSGGPLKERPNENGSGSTVEVIFAMV